MTSIYPIFFPKLKREERFEKCIIALTVQTGTLADAYRKILQDNKMSIDTFCNIGNEEIWPELSNDLHLDYNLPDECLEWDTYWNIARKDPELKHFFQEHHLRVNFMKALLNMRATRVKEVTTDLGRYIVSFLVQSF